MEKIEYIGEVLPDGHLSLPDDIAKQLKLKAHSKLRIRIEPQKQSKQDLTQFCGQWQDNNVDGVIEDIYTSRTKNNRSNNIDL